YDPPSLSFSNVCPNLVFLPQFNLIQNSLYYSRLYSAVILFEVFMSTQPTITITTRDYERLEKLLDSLSAEQYEKVEALAEELGRADVVSPQAVPAGVVTMN